MNDLIGMCAASDFASPSPDDMEHMNKEGHANLAKQILKVLTTEAII